MKRIIIVFTIILAFSLLMALGFWQLHRANQKTQLIRTYQHLEKQSPLTTKQILQIEILAKLRFYPVKLEGIPLNHYTILLDNVIQKGRAGYRVYTPILLDHNHVILLERDWIPQGLSRDHLPENIPGFNTKTVEGYLDFAYRNPFIASAIELKKEDKNLQHLQWPLRVQTLDVILLSRLIGKKVVPLLVVSNKQRAKSFPISPERHRAYAVQWFGLAIMLIIVSFCVYRTQRDKT